MVPLEITELKQHIRILILDTVTKGPGQLWHEVLASAHEGRLPVPSRTSQAAINSATAMDLFYSRVWSRTEI